MIHIVKNKQGEFYVVNISSNHEVLAASESFTRKSNAYKNISTQRLNFTQDSPGSILVQDDTLKKPKVVLLNGKGKLLATRYKPQSVYNPDGRGFIVNIPQYPK